MTNDLFGIAAALHDRGILTFDEVTAMKQHARTEGLHLGTYLLKHRIISSDELMEICKDYFRIPCADIKELDASLIENQTVQQELIESYHVIPIKKQGDMLMLGMTDPSDHEAVAAIRFHTGLRIQPTLISEEDYQRAINTYYRPNILYSQLQHALSRFQNQTSHKTMEDDDDQPVIRFVEQLLTDATEKNVSDIHIELNSQSARMRFRQDGILHHAATLPADFAARIITRIKVMANIDIAERRLPQDGRLTPDQQSHIDVRISTCPKLHGEKLVLRLLHGKQQALTLNDLGMHPDQLQLFEQTLAKPQGLIIVTGPTGSGKSATLYAALQHLNHTEKHIITIEDPVELELDGLTQINVMPQIGLTFASALRASMRQDPDIIMIGEIRDRETAETALQAAQTGHLVLTTLHTNSAADTVKRLQSMNIPDYLLNDSLSLIIAQRLLRKYCNNCRDKKPADECPECINGYRGRTGIYELLAIDPDIPLSENRVPSDLYQSGLLKIQQGITSAGELARVTGKAAHDN